MSSQPETHTVRVWDLPLRLFHWALVVAVTGAFACAWIPGVPIDWHARFGYAVLALLVFRGAEGFVAPLSSLRMRRPSRSPMVATTLFSMSAKTAWLMAANRAEAAIRAGFRLPSAPSIRTICAIPSCSAARAQSRASGQPVRWQPVEGGFRFRSEHRVFEAFAAYERRNDVLLLVPSVRDRARAIAHGA